MSQQSGDKTEKATPKKRRDAREKGQVFKSMDMVVALSMIVAVGVLSLAGSYMAESIKGLMRWTFSINTPPVPTLGLVTQFFSTNILRFLTIMLPVLAAALVAALILNYMQVGFLFTTKAMMPKFSRINIMEGFKRIFSSRTLVELAKSVIKLTVLAYVAYNEYTAQILKTRLLMSNSVAASAAVTMDMLFAIAFKLALALVIMAPFDYLYQWWKHERDLRMTKQEVKDEYKLMEGDPQIKGKIRQKQREMSAMRMMQAVAEADVVITNPTHYAVALSYKEEKNKAPMVVAKGKDYVAQKIKQAASDNDIQCVENRQLAQYLYFFCEIGDEVPEDVYHAVAEILAYIYKLKHNITGVRA